MALASRLPAPWVAVLLLWTLGLASGCAGHSVRWKASEQLATTAPTAVVVYPFRFRWPEPEWRTYQKSRDLVAAALSDRRFLVVGPDELTVYRPEDANVLAASTLLPRLMELGLTPGDAIVLRAWAEERREKTSRQTYDASGKPVGQLHQEQRVVIAHLELVDVGAGKVLLTGRRAIPFDPLATHPDFDPLRPLTVALGELVEDALERLDAAGPRPPEADLKLQVNPAAAAPKALADPLEAELLQLGFYAYFDSTWGPSDRKSLKRALRGARVTEVGKSAAEAGLRVGDLIVACNDMPVSGPETVLRHLARAETGVRLEVRRDAQTLSLILPRPDRD